MNPSKTSGTERQFPRALTPLIGRDREVQELSSLLLGTPTSLLTMVGPGGVGKTHLARHLATLLADTFDGTVDFVVLEHLLDPELVTSTIADALGFVPLPGEDAFTSLVRNLRDTRHLLFLDNMEQVVEASSMLTPLRESCPLLTLVVTSREALRLTDERLHAVHPLGLPPASVQSAPDVTLSLEAPAVQLFVARAQAVSPDFRLTPANRASVVEICRRTDGLPLAIELAAARLRSFPVETLATLFRDRLTLLSGRSRDLPMRLQTMRNAVQWSHDLLSPTERRMFRRLAVFAGGFRLDALDPVVGDLPPEAGSSAPRPDILDCLESLVDKSLVVVLDRAPERERFGMLESIRDFATEQLVASDDVEHIRRAHAAWCLATVEEVDLQGAIRGGNHAAIAGLEAEFDNFRAALGWYHERGQGEDLSRLCLGLHLLWHAGSRIEEGYQWSLKALALLRRHAGPETLQLRLLMLAGRSAWHLGYFTAAAEQLGQALALARTLGNSDAERKILLDRGLLAEMQGDDVEATIWFERALAEQRAAGNVRGVLVALTNLGDVAYRQGDMVASRRMSEEALRLVGTIVDPEMECLIHGNLGQIDLHDGQPLAAWSHYAQGWRLAHLSRNDLLRADIMIGTAGVALEAGRLTDAAFLLGAAEAWCTRFGSHMVPHHGLRRRLLERLAGSPSPEELDQAFERGRHGEDDVVFALVSSIDPARTSSRPTAIADLTPREVTVLQLLVEGASDKAIAETLFISPRTAMRHVGSILKKLGTNNRVAAASIAREWDLV